MEIINKRIAEMMLANGCENREACGRRWILVKREETEGGQVDEIHAISTEGIVGYWVVPADGKWWDVVEKFGIREQYFCFDPNYLIRLLNDSKHYFYAREALKLKKEEDERFENNLWR